MSEDQKTEVVLTKRQKIFWFAFGVLIVLAGYTWLSYLVVESGRG